MFRAKISIATRALLLDVKPAIHQAMLMGVQGVQFDLRNELLPRDYGETARRQLLYELSERNLQAASGHFPLRSPLIAPERMDERLAAICAAMEFAAQLKIRLLTLQIGRLPPEEDAESRAVILAVLSELAAHGNHQGVVLALLPCGESTENLGQLVSEVKTGPVTVDADLAGWVLNGQPPAQQLRALHALIGHVEVRDAVRGTGGIGREVPVGRGEIDWDEVAALLSEMEYAGWLNVDRTAGNDRAGDVGRAVQYLRQLFPGER